MSSPAASASSLASAAPTGSASAAIPFAGFPLATRAAKVTGAKSERLGLKELQNFEGLDEHILKAYVDNELAADREYKGHPHEVDGRVDGVSREDGRIVVVLDPAEDARKRLANKMRKVRLYVDTDDGVSTDMVTELHPDSVVIAICTNGLGADMRYITFEGCSVWANEGPGAQPDSSASAKH